MVTLFLGIITGTVIALILNKFLADKLESKAQKAGLKITAFIVCVILSLSFFAIGSLRKTLYNFLEGKINIINVSLSAAFPNVNIAEMNINSKDFISVSGEMQQITNNIDTSSEGFFRKMIFDNFSQRITAHVNAIQNNANNVAVVMENFGNQGGIISINSILHHFKDMALRRVSPFILLGQAGIIVLFLIYVAIYIGVYSFFKKISRKKTWQIA